MSAYPNIDCCGRCGSLFQPEQVCDRCRTDAETLRAAAAIVRRRSRKPRSLTTLVLCRPLELIAARVNGERT